MSNDPALIDRSLSDLIGSRICHDLISPIGAIGNGLELVSMAGGTSPELALVADSVAGANARLRFFRVAFGHAPADQGIGCGEIMSIVADQYRTSRLRIDWLAVADCRRREAKAAFLALMCLETALPFGGRITVERRDGRWQIEGAGDKLRIEDEVWNWLATGPRAELTPARVHFALLPEAVGRLGRQLALLRGATGMTLSF